jgi:hypothetical protein
MVSIRGKTLLSEIMDPDFIFVQKAGTCFLYVYFQGTGFLGVSIFMGTVYFILILHIIIRVFSTKNMEYINARPSKAGSSGSDYTPAPRRDLPRSATTCSDSLNLKQIHTGLDYVS